MSQGLADVSSSSLESIRDALLSGMLRAPLSRTSLIAFGLRAQLDALVTALEGHSKAACLSVIDAVLAERARYARPAPELVWTGPEGGRATARDTAVVMRELFEGARRRVVLAGYSFLNPEAILGPLHRAMIQHGVEAHFFVHVDQPHAREADADAYGQARLNDFLEKNWPFGEPVPELYCDRRALAPGWGAELCSLHAKCVAVDGERAFVSSANFTSRAQERNIEAGVLLHDATFALQLERQLLGLVEGGFVLKRGG